MQTTLLTIDDIIREVRALAAEHPDNVYQRTKPHDGYSGGSCSYDDGVCTDCSLGCIFDQD